LAGSLYPAESEELAARIAALMDAGVRAEPRLGWPKALIVPHAGLLYSGSIAAAAFAEWRRGWRQIRRVILVGPAHRAAISGIALPAADAFATPLGQVAVDRLAEALLSDLPFVTQSASAHAWEHSLEMQLPFLQHVLESFAIVPLAVGDATPQQVADAIVRLWGGPETVIALSTDLSHFHPRAEAEVLDDQTAERILALRDDIHAEEACGATALNGLLLAAQSQRLAIRRVAQGTSADAAGDMQSVVGYGAFALDDLDVTGAAPGRHLLALARQAIGHRLGLAPQPHPARWWLQGVGATFVTLKQHGELRGCVGTLEARWPLGEDLLANAVHAAFDDPRFSPVDQTDWPEISLEVQVLSAPEAIAFTDEADLLRQLQPHVDGLILECEGRRGAFLPHVWDEWPHKRQFLAHLRKNAGLHVHAPLQSCRVWRCRVARFTEPDTYA
jgi:AmmeMemoRadiSam system protein B/AmmeMemoRadiSam system protein A